MRALVEQSHRFLDRYNGLQIYEMQRFPNDVKNENESKVWNFVLGTRCFLRERAHFMQLIPHTLHVYV